MSGAWRLLGLAAALLTPGTRLWAWDGQAVIDVVPTAALVQTSPGAPWMQSESTELVGQAALSHTQPLAEGLSLSGTAWVMADTLPSGSPLVTPGTKVNLQSRILEVKLAWEAIPGTLIWDAGKKVIHPSSGFFRTPLNVLSHGALGNTANQSGSAVGTWEEGWIGTDVTVLVGGLTISTFLSPRLAWTSDADRALQYLSQPQDDWQDLTRIDVRVGEADVQLLGLLSTKGPGSSDPDLHAQLGAGLDTNIGDAVTVRAEVSAADVQDRIEVTDAALLKTGFQSVHWAPRALLGATWTNADQLSVMAEYYYNGAGFSGSSYDELISYARNRRETGSSAPDALSQFGTFSAGRHYGFARVSGKIDDKLGAAAWTQANLQDLSGLSAVVLTYSADKWTVNASIMDAWGSTHTEAGLLPLLWRLDLGVSLYF